MQGKEIYRKELAERLKEDAGEPYRPSNGTEGMIFQERYCYQCQKDTVEDQCDILLRTLLFDIGEEHYPREWIYDLDGQPTCTAFKEIENGD